MMKLNLHCPDFRIPERTYAARVVFEEFLGIDCRLIPCDEKQWRLTDTDGKRSLIMPDAFFSEAEKDWLEPASLPEQPLTIWDSAELGMTINLIDQKLPIIYGASEFSVRECPEPSNKQQATNNNRQVCLPIDIFGSAFYMLTRYEEVVKQDRDEHNRFPAWASLAYQEGFLERPIIDEYVELLWGAMKGLWPGLERIKHSFQIKLTHDVDRPSRYLFGSFRQYLRSAAGDLVKRGNVKAVLKSPWIRWGCRDKIHRSDPGNTFDWIMDVSEKYGIQSAFYFMCGGKGKTYGPDYDIEHPAIRHLMHRIYDRGHEIGLHGSYHAYTSPAVFAGEANRLRKVCEEENICTNYLGTRMHYLRWSTPKTLECLEEAGIDYDTTLGFADRPGFRCGTCHQFPLYNIKLGQRLHLYERPLIAMESSIFSSRYLGIVSQAKSLELFLKMKRNIQKLKGDYVMLWHNTEIKDISRQHIYKSIIQLNDNFGNKKG